MNNMKKIILTAVAATAIAVSAQAQTVQVLSPNRAYIFTSTAASGEGTITYQWYRNGEPIEGATSQGYTLPGSLAYGINVEFKRGAISNTCSYAIAYTAPFYITFCAGAFVNNVCWASANIVQPEVFASSPDQYTSFFLYNTAVARAASGTVSSWGYGNGSTWTNKICPEGWRMASSFDFSELNNAGSTWVNNGTRGATVPGRFYGPNHNSSANCTLPSNMNNCIFLPAGGYRNDTGVLSGQSTSGYYWQSNNSGSYLTFSSSNSNPSAYTNPNPNSCGMNVRCVQDVK